MANISVTFEEMNSAANRLNSGKDEITTSLNGLKGFIDDLIRNGFVTERASGAFGKNYEDFTKNATETISALEGLASYLNTAAQTLADTDEQLAASLG